MKLYQKGRASRIIASDSVRRNARAENLTWLPLPGQPMVFELDIPGFTFPTTSDLVTVEAQTDASGSIIDKHEMSELPVEDSTTVLASTVSYPENSQDPIAKMDKKFFEKDCILSHKTLADNGYHWCFHLAAALCHGQTKLE